MSQRRTAWAIVLGTLAVSVTGTLITVLRARRPPPASEERIAVTGVLGGGGAAAGFERAMEPRPFSFPADHGPHPSFRSEWWYLTGHLQAGARRFGYQLTIFRQALAPSAPERRSAWASRQVYMGHLAIADVDVGRFGAFERLAREGLALGGAQARPLRVWVDDWQMAGADGGDPFPLRVRARAERGLDEPGAPRAVTLELTIGAGRGPIPQGDRGLSVKGPEPGNASHYYSHTRMPTEGRLMVDGAAREVTGTSWLDREWSTSALGPELAGWDWLSLHLDDGRDLMIYRLRRKDGTAAPESRATVIAPDGSTTVVPADGFSLSTVGTWRSPASGAVYPVRLAARVPSAGIDLQIAPLLEDQELRLSVRYWEGAVRAAGSTGGTGYLELTGYGRQR